MTNKDVIKCTKDNNMVGIYDTGPGGSIVINISHPFPGFERKKKLYTTMSI